MYKLTTLAGLLAAGALLSGCASIVNGTSESIAITTPPTTGATCELSNGVGTWTVTSPGAVTVDRSKHDAQITCKKDGFQDASATIPSDFEGWTLGNLLIGGVIGIGVDAATGAMHNYPHAFAVPMTAVPTASAPADTSAPATSTNPSS